MLRILQLSSKHSTSAERVIGQCAVSPLLLAQLILLRQAPRFGKRYVCVIHQSRRRTDLRVDDARSIKHFRLIPVYAMHMHACAYASRCIQCARLYMLIARTLRFTRLRNQKERAYSHVKYTLYLKTV